MKRAGFGNIVTNVFSCSLSPLVYITTCVITAHIVRHAYLFGFNNWHDANIFDTFCQV